MRLFYIFLKVIYCHVLCNNLTFCIYYDVLRNGMQAESCHQLAVEEHTVRDVREMDIVPFDSVFTGLSACIHVNAKSSVVAVGLLDEAVDASLHVLAVIVPCCPSEDNAGLSLEVSLCYGVSCNVCSLEPWQSATHVGIAENIQIVLQSCYVTVLRLLFRNNFQ